MKIKVEEDGELLEYLYNRLDMSKKKIKSYLTHGSIYVNQTKTTKYNYKVTKGMTILIDTKNKNSSNLVFDILYEDDYIIVVNKPSGLLTISTAKEKEKTLYHLVGEYLKRKNKNNKVFIVHRLDKDTSGIVLFAKDEKTKNKLQKDWNNIVKVREYTAVVLGNLEHKKGRLVNKLMETKTNLVYITNKQEGKEAITNYEVIKKSKDYSLLKINIETGRKNQIRVQLANIGNPIVGDNKYGKNLKKYNRLYLHACRLTLFYPMLKKEITFNALVPKEFKKLV